ncbi:Fc.00g006920.m01.CDS01 [Cosmosporella sp. VM-42]
MSEDDPGLSSTQDWQGNDAPSPSGSARTSEADDDKPNDAGDAPSQPIQKRRRVTRACDECRRKKIKRRNPAPQYIEALESRLQRAETLLHKFMPDVDLADPNLDPAVQQEFYNREHARAQAAKAQMAQRGPLPPHPPEVDPNETQLMSMIDSIGQLDIDDKGGWDFHGISSGAVFLRRMKEQFRGLMGPVGKMPFLPRSERPPGLMNLDSPSSAGNSPFSAVSSYPDLPPKDLARKLCYYSLSCATCLVRIVHVPTFYDRFEKLYERPLDNLSKDEAHFLGLLYAVMALGCMYNNLDDSGSETMAYKEATEEGLKYYNTARALLQDITDCRDLTSLQALLFMILFLQATSNLSGCYAFVGIALRSALRIGLHRHLQHEKLNTIEQEVRKRVFYVIRQMDIYVSTLLGFPLLLNTDDFDQPFPTEVDDEFLTPSGILQPPPGTPSFFEAFNAHSQLMEILSKITKYVYPMKGLGQSVMKDNKPTSTYLISYGRIKEIEADLHTWFERLPQNWRPSAEGPIEVVRVRHLLRFAYAHVQLVLYRPFLHYVSPRLSQGTKVDELSYACAAAAISVSRNIVHIGLEIRKQRVLSGPYWFMLYTEFFAVLSLVFYATENPEKPGSNEVLADARAGREMIAALAEKSMSADRVSNALKVLFDQLPERLDQGVRPIPSKKRSAPSNRPGSVSSHQPTMPTTISSIRTDDLARRGSQLTGSSFMTSVTRSSVDTIRSPSQGYHDPTFSSNLSDFMSVDMQRATPESTSTATSSQRAAYPTAPLSVHNPVHKLDTLMFPSEDPFAYPNQPMMELGFPGKTDPPASMADPSQDSQFFLTGSFDDVDSQIFGQPPPYMIHQQGQPMMNVASHMYDPSMMGMQAGHPMAQQHAVPQPQHQPQPQPQHPLASRRAHTQRHQERQIQQMFTQQGMQADWGSFFGSGRGGFQGM